MHVMEDFTHPGRPTMSQGRKQTRFDVNPDAITILIDVTEQNEAADPATAVWPGPTAYAEMQADVLHGMVQLGAIPPSAAVALPMQPFPSLQANPDEGIFVLVLRNAHSCVTKLPVKTSKTLLTVPHAGKLMRGGTNAYSVACAPALPLLSTGEGPTRKWFGHAPCGVSDFALQNPAHFKALRSTTPTTARAARDASPTEQLRMAAAASASARPPAFAVAFWPPARKRSRGHRAGARVQESRQNTSGMPMDSTTPAADDAAAAAAVAAANDPAAEMFGDPSAVMDTDVVSPRASTCAHTPVPSARASCC